MPRKPRDYKAEYAARKAKAERLGYTSVRTYRTAREKGERKQAADWSRQHSHSRRSRFSDNFSKQQTEDFLKAYVSNPSGSRRSRAKAKRRAIFDYLVEYDYIEEQDWHEDWKSGEANAN